MIFWRKIFPRFFAALVTSTLPIFAQPDPEKPDPKGLRDSLATAEVQHREAYAASRFADAVNAARGGLALADRGGTMADKVQFIRHLAYDNWLIGDIDSSIDYAQRLLDCAEQLNDNRLRAQGHRYLSQVYETMEDDTRMRAHAEQSMRFAKLAGDDDVRIFALTAIGHSDARAQHYDAALRAFEDSHAYWEKKKAPWNAVNSLVDIADVTVARGDLAGALKRYEEILAARIANNDRSGQVRALATIADLLRRLGRPDEALPRLVATRALAESIGSHRVLAEFYGSLAKVHEALRDFSAALATERLAATERELLSSERARLRATELESRLDLIQKQEAIEQLRSIIAVNEAKVRMTDAELAKDRAFRIAVLDGVVAITLIGAAGLIVMRYRARHKRFVAVVSDTLKPWSDRPGGDAGSWRSRPDRAVRMKPVHFASAADFRDWLERHHASARELLVGFHYKTSGRGGLTYAAALDEALCLGWIDGVRKKIGAARYSIRFTPRQPGSIWSNVNVAHIARLRAAGRLQPAGLAAFAARRAGKTGIYSFENRARELPAALAKKFRARRKAWAFFTAQAPWFQRTAIFQIVTAKLPATRERRLAQLIADSAAGRRLRELARPTRR